MNEIKEPQECLTTRPHSHNMLAGIILILIGTGLLITYWLQLAWIPVLWVGLGVLVWGVARHYTRLIILGGLITGTGFAIVMQTGPWATGLTDPAHTGLFLICLSLGWLLIILMTWLATDKVLWWPVVPGFVLVTTGVAFLASAGWVEALSSLAWPALLVILGLILILRWNRAR
jgi:hypothetical protein